MTSEKSTTRYPGGSKSRVDKAGDNIRKNQATIDDIKTFEEWRSTHRIVINTFQSYFRMATIRSKKLKIIVAQRHKRKNTITDKLARYPSMSLSRMDDIAGCRLIFENLIELYAFRKRTRNAKVTHTIRNPEDKYDYIRNPKPTGYRGIHDIYVFNATAATTKEANGLFIEVQYRTRIQHAWATAVEVVGHIAESQPKFQTGDRRYHEAMALASEILARAHEDSLGPFPEMNDQELLKKFIEIDKKLSLIKKLKELNQARQTISESKNAILIFSKDNELEVIHIDDDIKAIFSLFEMELKFPEKDIVLVSAKKNEDIRFAFKNYFSDAQEFTQYLSEGIEIIRSRIPKKTLKFPKKISSSNVQLSEVAIDL